MSKSFNNIGLLEYNVINDTHLPQFLEIVYSNVVN